MPSRVVQALFLAGSFLLLGGLDLAHAQSMDASSLGGPVTISAPWRFHFGDDPAWSTPAFDDSRWALHSATRNWSSENGGRPISGYAWYRLRVTLPKTTEPLALAVYPLASADEIYINGALEATVGHMRPAPKWVSTHEVYAIHIPAAFHGQSVEIAIRAWLEPLVSNGTAAGAAHSSPVLGYPGDIQRIVDGRDDRYWLDTFPEGVLDVVAVVVGLFSFGLFILQREAREYGWAAIYLIGSAFHDLFARIIAQNGAEIHVTAQIFYILLSLLLVVWLLFTWGFLRARADRLFYALVAACAIGPAATALVLLGQFSVAAAYVFYAGMYLILAAGIFVRLFALARKGNRDAQLFLVPFFLNTGMSCAVAVMAALAWAGFADSVGLPALHHFPRFEVTWQQFFTLLSYLAIGAVLVLRFTRASRQEQRLTTEMESARRVQAQLVPAQLPSLPHFAFDVAYRAASEVGGDFYQVFPRADNSALILLGDVSGKGLKAAMLGTLIVGAAGALAQEDIGPAKMLERLNRHLCGRTDGGFATCLCALLTPAGVLTLANAGQLSPYHNGREAAAESGLPLGIVPQAEYAETTLQLAPGDTLTFLSDGVVEARAPGGELFGFERTREISARPAAEIAAVAQQFGQEDDITVLRLTLEPAGVLT